jgi:hypothetical protein
MAQAEAYLAGGLELRQEIAHRARELGELTRRYGVIAASLADRSTGPRAEGLIRQ